MRQFFGRTLGQRYFLLSIFGRPRPITISYMPLQLEALQHLALAYVASSSAKTYSREQICSYFITLCRANLLLRVIDREIGHVYCKIVSVLSHMCEALKAVCAEPVAWDGDLMTAGHRMYHSRNTHTCISKRHNDAM